MHKNFNFLADLPFIERYNKIKGDDSPHRLQAHMGPAPFDGDPYSASIVLLMNNPGFYEGSVPEDHSLVVPGWPLAGLAPQARAGFQKWYRRPLGTLIKKYGEKVVANKVAIVQRCAWASTSFDGDLKLPSTEFQNEVALQALRRGAVVVVGRSHRYWTGVLAGDSRLLYAKNPRNPTLTEGGLGSVGWEQIRTALQ
jgi:hypothetical protein